MAQLAASPALGANTAQPKLGIPAAGSGSYRLGHGERSGDDGLQALDAALLALSRRIPLEVAALLLECGLCFSQQAWGACIRHACPHSPLGNRA